MSDPITTPTVASTPAANPEPHAAAEQAALAVTRAKAAQQEGEAREEQAREECQATLKALVRAYSRGERDYRQGLIEAGRLAHDYITRRLTLGDKRAAAVQAIEGQLAAYASDTVDVNRLVRVYQAYRLLCDEPGLAKPAANVPYGHYRDAWCLLVERIQKDTPEEGYALLPGSEQQCLAAFAECVSGGLSKAACLERAKALVQDHARRAEEQARRESEAKEVAQREAVQRAKAERQAMERAEAEAKAKAVAAAAAEQEAKDAADDAAKAEALAKAEQAKAEAEFARKAADAKRFAEEQAAREAARAAQEARDAARKQAEAEARRASQERKAERRERRQEQPQPPAPECRGENLLKSVSKATVKDAASMLVDAVQGHDDPEALLYDLVRALLAGHAKLPAEAVARTLFLALDHAKAKLPEQAGKAVQAARLVLTRKDKGEPSANGKPVPAAA